MTNLDASRNNLATGLELVLEPLVINIPAELADKEVSTCFLVLGAIVGVSLRLLVGLLSNRRFLCLALACKMLSQLCSWKD